MPGTEVKVRDPLLGIFSPLGHKRVKWGAVLSSLVTITYMCSPSSPTTKVWTQRLLSLQEIDLESDWKLITLFIGSNDMCHYCENPVGPCPTPWKVTLACCPRHPRLSHC